MPVPGAPAGTRLRMRSAIGSKRATGTCLPGNGVLLSGSMMLARDAEKSPARWAAVGVTELLVVGATLSRVPWYEKKKKVLSLRIGPPMVPPNWFRFRPSWDAAKKLRAFRSLLRRN